MDGISTGAGTSGVEMDELTRMMVESGFLSPGAVGAPAEVEIADEVDDGAVPELDEVSGAIEINGAIEEPPELEELVELPDETLTAVAGAIAADEIRAESYAEQDSEVGFVEPPIEAPKVPGKPRKAKSTGPVTRGRGMSPAEYVAKLTGDTTLVGVVETLPKKVKEKAANLFDHLHGGKSLSVFTRVALTMLAAEGSISGPRLVAALQAGSKRGGGDGYSLGTARSQAQQQMTLLAKLGIAKRDGDKLVPDPESALWQALSGTAQAGEGEGEAPLAEAA
jgi:hypothetical protein